MERGNLNQTGREEERERRKNERREEEGKTRKRRLAWLYVLGGRVSKRSRKKKVCGVGCSWMRLAVSSRRARALVFVLLLLFSVVCSCLLMLMMLCTVTTPLTQPRRRVWLLSDCRSAALASPRSDGGGHGDARGEEVGVVDSGLLVVRLHLRLDGAQLALESLVLVGEGRRDGCARVQQSVRL